MSELKKTPLYSVHVRSGAKIIDFGGWAMPVQYTGILDEHKNVRTKVGIFDVSHMGEISVKGKGAFDFIQNLITNDISNMYDGKVIYSPMCNENGGTVDDLVVYRLAQDDYIIIVNAANTDKDYSWIIKNNAKDANIANISENIAQLAVQGPLAKDIIAKLTDNSDVLKLKYYTFMKNIKLGGIDTVMVSRTGYTGEDGFEVYVKSCDAETMWDLLIDTGKPMGIMPCGLGARDTLRFESSMPLYGNELSDDISPIEAGLEHFVKINKKDFIGKDILLKQIKNGINRKRAGFIMIDRGVPRSGYEIMSGDQKIGIITSGTFCPTLKNNYGMGLIKSEYASIGNTIEINIRGKNLKAEIINMPFYKRNK